MRNAEKYIYDNWDNVIRVNTKDTAVKVDGKDDILIGLPFPYTVPCADGIFQELYYWDTYFTNTGLILSGRLADAKNNVNNICYLVDNYGFMPNGNRKGYLTRSQPPFLSRMVLEVYGADPDKDWLKKCYSSLEKEYDFWQSRRLTPSGLNRYYGDLSIDEKIYYGKYFCRERMCIPIPDDEKLLISYGKNVISLAESGWDCNSRCGLHADEYNGLDLNSLLYGMEKDMEFISGELENGDGEIWSIRAKNRKKLINKLLWDKKSAAYFDYDFVNKKRSSLISSAVFYPMFVFLPDREQAAKTVKELQKIEFEYGVASTENKDGIFSLQWDYPNAWPCQQQIVISALLNYGYKDDALRIAKKYVKLIDKTFIETGKLWEKYNAVTGEVSVTSEYETPEMMGWSAGVYLYCIKLIENNSASI